MGVSWEWNATNKLGLYLFIIIVKTPYNGFQLSIILESQPIFTVHSERLSAKPILQQKDVKEELNELQDLSDL